MCAVSVTSSRSLGRQDGETGVATMYLLLNQAPMGGTCTVTPPEGRVVNLRAHGVVAAEDSAQAANDTSADVALANLPTPGRALTEDWYVECIDFKDPDKDKIGKYVFFIKHPIEGYIIIMKFGKDRKGKFVFPYGDWELWMTISDNYDASRDIFIDHITTSLPTKGEYATWELKKDVPRAMGEGDQPRLSQLLQARTSLADIELPDDPTEATTTPAYDYYDESVETETMDPEELLEIQAEQERKRLEALDNKALVRGVGRCIEHWTRTRPVRTILNSPGCMYNSVY
ncbi:hypothetical protein FJT64_009597 [Amphibalanus amphitrite]|uniref:Uncharacterized protein n=1 Tax=Amphibalanus amphitrite TaxID=1232801 RepID=A0A6A4VGY4_AMPAM|nr:hypothetical protein FJT64_009597 [Amphibalanus amphitrite]